MVSGICTSRITGSVGATKLDAFWLSAEFRCLARGPERQFEVPPEASPRVFNARRFCASSCHVEASWADFRDFSDFLSFGLSEDSSPGFLRALESVMVLFSVASFSFASLAAGFSGSAFAVAASFPLRAASISLFMAATSSSTALRASVAC